MDTWMMMMMMKFCSCPFAWNNNIRLSFQNNYVTFFNF